MAKNGQIFYGIHYICTKKAEAVTPAKIINSVVKRRITRSKDKK